MFVQNPRFNESATRTAFQTKLFADAWRYFSSQPARLPHLPCRPVQVLEIVSGHVTHVSTPSPVPPPRDPGSGFAKSGSCPCLPSSWKRLAGIVNAGLLCCPICSLVISADLWVSRWAAQALLGTLRLADEDDDAAAACEDEQPSKRQKPTITQRDAKPAEVVRSCDTCPGDAGQLAAAINASVG